MNVLVHIHTYFSMMSISLPLSLSFQFHKLKRLENVKFKSSPCTLNKKSKFGIESNRCSSIISALNVPDKKYDGISICILRFLWFVEDKECDKNSMWSMVPYAWLMKHTFDIRINFSSKVFFLFFSIFTRLYHLELNW